MSKGKPAKRKFRSSTVEFLYDRYVGSDPERIRDYEEEALNAEIARSIYQLRTRAGLTQRELANRIGTSTSSIKRLEDADYEGSSLLMLKRIAQALDKRLEISIVDARNRRLQIA